MLEQPSAIIVEPGSGDEIRPGDLVGFDVLQLSGANGAEFGGTWQSDQTFSQTTDSDAFSDEFRDALLSARVGARLLAAGPGLDGSGEQVTRVEVFDITGTTHVLARAEGLAADEDPSLPRVVLNAEGSPGMVAAGGQPPVEPTMRSLVQGRGEPVRTGAAVAMRYTAWLWDGVEFDSTWNDETPVVVQSVGSGELLRDLDKALVGHPAGSRLLIVSPPGTGSSETSVPETPEADRSALVFVVDILAAGDSEF